MKAPSAPVAQKRLPLKNRLLLVVASLCLISGLVFVWLWLDRGLFPDIEESLHKYYFHGAVDFCRNAPRPLLYGPEQVSAYLAQPGAGLQTLLDFVFILLYGGVFLVAFRTLLLGYPKHLFKSARWCFWLFGLPLCLGMAADFSENLILLYANADLVGLDSAPAATAISHELATTLSVLTLAKTAFIGVTFVCLSLFSVLFVLGPERWSFRKDKLVASTSNS